MHRHTRHVAEMQIPLDLEPTVNAGSESALRAAYQRLRLSRKFSFERAMSNRALAIGIHNLADAIARRLVTRRATKAQMSH